MAGLTEPSQVGKREDLADIYSIVDMKSTPFCTRVQKSSKPTNSEFDWIVDAYASVSVAGTIDGTDVPNFGNAAASRGRLGNYVQVFRVPYKVSRLAEDLSNVAGVRSEIALATAKGLVEIKRNQETTFLQNGVDGQADDGSKPYLTASLGKWIDTTGPTTPRSVPAAYRTASAQISTTATASLAEDTDVQGILKAIYDNTGMSGDYVLFAGSTLRRRFTDMTRCAANFTNSATKPRMFNYDGTQKSLTHTTTIYEGDYGSMEVVSSNFVGNDYTTGGNTGKNVGYVVDMDKVHLRTLSKPAVERFEDQGGGPRLLVEAVAGLQVDNPIGLGAFKPAS